MPDSSNLLIRTRSGEYHVSIGTDIISGNRFKEDTVWIIDANVARLHSGLIPSSFIKQEAVESAKNLNSVASIIEQLRDHGSTRQTEVIAVGGGIIQDLTTFSASCYMRGIRWTYCPTTMLSMVDSCIGGKSSINVGRYKNIAGNFYPPTEILIDTQFCKTLTAEQMAEGLCEAAKICYADSDNAFDTYLELVEGCTYPPRDERLIRLIRHSLQSKRQFIETDEFDQGIRLLLNFGHTFGHAIEGATSYEISHGIAVGLGILAAEHCSVRLGYASAGLKNITNLTAHVRHLLRYAPNLANKLRRMNPTDAMAYLMSDKKHTTKYFTLILFDHLGRLQQVKLPRVDSIQTELISTFQHLKEQTNEIQ